MWMFTKIGFFSAVSAKNQKTGKLDVSRVVVRARRREHLIALADYIKEQQGIKKPAIQEKDGTDYPCRIVVPADVWATACTHLAEDIDYDNFKGSIPKDNDGGEYHNALTKIWVVMRTYQYAPQVRKRF